jgi:hypothetical protein
MANRLTTSSKHLKQRRQFVKSLVTTFCATSATTLLSPMSLSSAFAFEANVRDKSADGVVLSNSQLNTLGAICEAILPRTDTPGAADADCHGFIDHHLYHCYSKKHVRTVIKIINTINKSSKSLYKTAFEQSSLLQQQSLLRKLEATRGFTSRHREQFKFVKELTLFGFFTSESGATEVLPYQAVPGGYKGVIPVNEGTRTWGSLGFY